jgi:hypothetical protein
LGEKSSIPERGHLLTKQAGRAKKLSALYLNRENVRKSCGLRDWDIIAVSRMRLTRNSARCLMVRFHEQIIQETQQRIRELAEPSPFVAQVLDQVASVRRNEELARSLGLVFPDEFKIPGVKR